MPAHDSGPEEKHASREERLAIVDEHVEQENQHDLDGIMATFGEDPCITMKGKVSTTMAQTASARTTKN